MDGGRHRDATCPASKQAKRGSFLAFSLVSESPGKLAADTGDPCLKTRRIPLGLLYIATLVLMIILIPLIQFGSRQASTMMHRQSSAMTLRLDKLKL